MNKNIQHLKNRIELLSNRNPVENANIIKKITRKIRALEREG